MLRLLLGLNDGLLEALEEVLLERKLAVLKFLLCAALSGLAAGLAEVLAILLNMFVDIVGEGSLDVEPIDGGMSLDRMVSLFQLARYSSVGGAPRVYSLVKARQGQDLVRWVVERNAGPLRPARTAQYDSRAKRGTLPAEARSCIAHIDVNLPMYQLLELRV